MPRKKSLKKSQSVSRRTLGSTDLKLVKRGEDMYGYGEQKKACNLSLTQASKNKLTELANKQKVSRSELVERWLRQDDPLASTTYEDSDRSD